MANPPPFSYRVKQVVWLVVLLPWFVVLLPFLLIERVVKSVRRFWGAVEIHTKG